MNLIKLAVGVDSIDDLKQRQDYYAMVWNGYRVNRVITRQYPKQADQLLKGGSLFWVVKGQIVVRQTIRYIEAQTDPQGQMHTAIFLDPVHHAVMPTPRRPFQGWRYLSPDAAPRDISAAEQAMDPALHRELRELGLA
jgi:hypothetical protein